MNSIAYERINLRTTPEAKQTIEQAAALMGTSVSAFMVQHAYEHALALIEQHQTIMLNRQQWQHLQDMLTQPKPANAALKELMQLGETLV